MCEGSRVVLLVSISIIFYIYRSNDWHSQLVLASYRARLRDERQS
jgi:hypothetical protein